MKKLTVFETEDGFRFDDFEEAVKSERTSKAAKKFREFFPFDLNSQPCVNPFYKSASYFIDERHKLLECMKEIIKIMDD